MLRSFLLCHPVFYLCPNRREEHKTLSSFAFSQTPLLLLVVNSSILTLFLFMDQQEIRVFGLACAHNTITGILLLCGPAYFGPALHARLYLALYHNTRTVMIQLPMHVLHGMCYSFVVNTSSRRRREGVQTHQYTQDTGTQWSTMRKLREEVKRETRGGSLRFSFPYPVFLLVNL